MSKRNQLTGLHRQVLAPLTGKIATGFRRDKSPDTERFSDKFTVRLRDMERHDSEMFLGVHYKYYGAKEDKTFALNISTQMMMTEFIEFQEPFSGFTAAEHDVLHEFLREPLSGFHMFPNQSLVIIFAHQSLFFEIDHESDRLHLGWAVTEGRNNA